MLLSAEHLSINFGSRQLLDDVNFYLNEGDKVGVIGINGTGKSTFLKVLSGVTEPDGGTISRNPNVQVSLLPQNPAMEESATVLEQVFLHFPAEFRELNEYEAKAMLNRLGITDFAQKVGTLSGGQRKRVALAAALIHPADVLILDEPTNHLDITSKEILESALCRYTGTVLYVSHDRYFINRTATRILDLTGQSLINYIGSYDYYLEKKDVVEAAFAARNSRTLAVPGSSQSPDRPSQGSPNDLKLEWKAQKEEQARIRRIQNELRKTEESIHALETRDSEIDALLTLEEVYTDVPRLMELNKEKEEIAGQLEKLYQSWEELAEEA